MNIATETYRRALDIALDELITLLKEAQDYLASEKYDLAAIGTLSAFSDKAEDLKAALRLYTRAKQQQRGAK